MKKIIAFIILVILVILVICLSYNYYKKQDTKRINKLKTDLETSEVLNNKNKNDNDNDRIEVEEQDTNKSSKTKKKTSEDSDEMSDGETQEETNMNVPDTASDDNNGFVKLDYYTIDVASRVKVGKTTQIKVNYYPSNASIKDTTFISENKNCKVSSLGKVKGLKKGTCSIVVKVKDQNTQSVLLTVK